MREFRFNDSPDLATMPNSTGVVFDSNGTTYSRITRTQQGASMWGIYAICCVGESDEEVITYVNNPSGSYGITHGWKDEAYKTIVIHEEPSSSEFVTWLKANATKQT